MKQVPSRMTNLRTLWFESYVDAIRYRTRAALAQMPQKRMVWIYPHHEYVWSLQIKQENQS